LNGEWDGLLIRDYLQPKRRGSMKKAGVIFLVIILIVVIIGLLICMNADKLANLAVEKSFGAMEKAVLQKLPASIPQDSVRTAFSEALMRVKAGEVDKTAFQGFAQTVQSAFTDQKLDSIEIAAILKGLDALKKP
jgi:hypothetical protein